MRRRVSGREAPSVPGGPAGPTVSRRRGGAALQRMRERARDRRAGARPTSTSERSRRSTAAPRRPCGGRRRVAGGCRSRPRLGAGDVRRLSAPGPARSPAVWAGPVPSPDAVGAGRRTRAAAAGPTSGGRGRRPPSGAARRRRPARRAGGVRRRRAATGARRRRAARPDRARTPPAPRRRPCRDARGAERQDGRDGRDAASPARPSVVSPTASGRVKASRGDPKAATSRRQPPGRSAGGVGRGQREVARSGRGRQRAGRGARGRRRSAWRSAHAAARGDERFGAVAVGRRRASGRRAAATSSGSWVAWSEAGVGHRHTARRAVAADRFPRRGGEPGRVGRGQAEVARSRAGSASVAVARGERDAGRRGAPRSRGHVATSALGRVRARHAARSSVEQRATTTGRGRAARRLGVAAQPRNSSIRSSSRSRKRQPAAMDPGLDRPERDAGHLGDLGVVVALDVEQDDRGALVVGDPGQGVGQGAGPLGEQRGPLRVGLGAGRRLPALVLELRVRLDGPALAGPLGVHRRVDADPVEPRLDAAATERASGCGTPRRTPPGRQSEAWSRSGTIRTTSANSWSW